MNKADIIRFFKKIYWFLPLEIKEWIRVIHTLIPGRLGEFFRMKYYKKRFKECGDMTKIAPHVTIYHPENIETGKWVQFSRYSHINASGGVKVGTDTLIGPYVKIISANHNYQILDIPVRKQGWTRRQVIIGDDVWIGTGAIILPGVTIGDHAVIGGGSVVTKDVPPYSICVGNPGRIIGTRKDEKLGSYYNQLN